MPVVVDDDVEEDADDDDDDDEDDDDFEPALRLAFSASVCSNIAICTERALKSSRLLATREAGAGRGDDDDDDDDDVDVDDGAASPPWLRVVRRPPPPPPRDDVDVDEAIAAAAAAAKRPLADRPGMRVSTIAVINRDTIIRFCTLIIYCQRFPCRSILFSCMHIKI